MNAKKNKSDSETASKRNSYKLAHAHQKRLTNFCNGDDDDDKNKKATLTLNRNIIIFIVRDDCCTSIK